MVWRCFHCDETFRDPKLAELHFGPSWTTHPLCQIDGKKFRALETLLIRYQDEDTDLHRQVGRMQSDHVTALKREEERGYASGLRDSVPAGMVYAVAAKDKRKVHMLFDTPEQANAFVSELSKYPGYSSSLPPSDYTDVKREDVATVVPSTTQGN